ncbi:MAG: hypothetical protein ACP5HQ_06895 [Thermoprotei archaeon]
MASDKVYAEVVLAAPADKVMEYLSNPFVVVGAFGHVSALTFKGARKDEFVALSELSDVPRAMRVVYILSFENDKPQCAVGYMAGPEPMGDGLRYFGWSDTEELRWELVIQVSRLRQDSTRTGVSLSVNAN